MKKAFEFVESLKSNFTDLLGYPTIKTHSDYVEVCFKTTNVLRSVAFLNVPCDEYRIFANNDFLHVVFTFYKS